MDVLLPILVGRIVEIDTKDRCEGDLVDFSRPPVAALADDLVTFEIFSFFQRRARLLLGLLRRFGHPKSDPAAVLAHFDLVTDVIGHSVPSYPRSSGFSVTALPIARL